MNTISICFIGYKHHFIVRHQPLLPSCFRLFHCRIWTGFELLPQPWTLNYMDWYQCPPYAVDQYILATMKKSIVSLTHSQVKGWRPRVEVTTYLAFRPKAWNEQYLTHELASDLLKVMTQRWIPPAMSEWSGKHLHMCGQLCDMVWQFWKKL